MALRSTSQTCLKAKLKDRRFFSENSKQKLEKTGLFTARNCGIESVAIELIGDAIEDALGAEKDDSVDPIKLIEDLLGGG